MRTIEERYAAGARFVNADNGAEMRLATIALTVVLAACAADGNPMSPVIHAIFPTPDIQGCIDRGSPWAWDRVAKRCVALSPEQEAELDAQAKASWNRMVERQRALANDPRHREIADCIDRLSRAGFIQTYSGEMFEICSGTGFGTDRGRMALEHHAWRRSFSERPVQASVDWLHAQVLARGRVDRKYGEDAVQ
jgi:hypothetical protein